MISEERDKREAEEYLDHENKALRHLEELAEEASHNSQPMTFLKKENFFIALSGIIGAGKSTLADALSKVTGLPVYYEKVSDNRYLRDFYKDMKKYSFSLQVDLLTNRFSQQSQLHALKNGGIMDRSIYEDSVFARMLTEQGLMEPRDFETYQNLFSIVLPFIVKPSCILHLDVSPEISLERIKKRGREEEKGITLEYLKSLSRAYDAFLIEISKSIPVIRLNWNAFGDTEETALKIKQKYEEMLHIHYI